jgi:hypothetical protein
MPYGVYLNFCGGDYHFCERSHNPVGAVCDRAVIDRAYSQTLSP